MWILSGGKSSEVVVIRQQAVEPQISCMGPDPMTYLAQPRGRFRGHGSTLQVPEPLRLSISGGSVLEGGGQENAWEFFDDGRNECMIILR